AGTGNSDGAASPDDSDRRAVAVPAASYGSDASCCCYHGCCRGCYRGDHPSLDCDRDSDRVETAGDVAVPVAAVAVVAAAGVVAAIPSRDSVAAAGAAVPNAAVVP